MYIYEFIYIYVYAGWTKSASVILFFFFSYTMAPSIRDIYTSARWHRPKGSTRARQNATEHRNAVCTRTSRGSQQRELWCARTLATQTQAKICRNGLQKFKKKKTNKQEENMQFIVQYGVLYTHKHTNTNTNTHTH